MSIERRRDRRYPFRLKAVVAHGRNELQGETEDVSYTGLSLRTGARLAERQFVRLRVILPPEGGELTVTGMVTRSSAPSDGNLARAGVQLYGLAPEQRESWNKLIRLAARGLVPANAPGQAATHEPTRRRYPRYAAALNVRLHTVADLHELYTLNVSRGGLFVRTKLPLEVGTRVKVSVVHPRTGEQFPLEAVVRRRAEAPEPGLGLELVGVTDQRRDEFFEFVRSTVPIEDVYYVATRDAGTGIGDADLPDLPPLPALPALPGANDGGDAPPGDARAAGS